MNFLDEQFGANGFVGEHLWVGQLGHLFIVLSFVASLLATISFFTAEFSKVHTSKNDWNKLGRVAYFLQSLSIFSIFSLLFYMIFNHLFEYHYVWRHSSVDLPTKYIISSFWEGQEGSFLLWQFWLSVLGLVAIQVTKDWENPVMGMVSVTQLFLGSMVLGIYILGYKVGSNPFVLLRNEMANAPIFQKKEYLTFIADGNGLNPLLQNYWMTIHPPVLFCGFASTLFPFAFAIASLIRKDYNGWLKPAMPWVLFSVSVLGTGILMGGAWAYESLSFGGFWAWDPVENSSFVPWLMIVAGLHTMLVYKYTRHSLISTFVFFILGFGFVLYSTFLTRSGILGDTSVHAFTDLGMTGQLVIYLLCFLIPAFVLLIFRSFSIESPKQEEELWSREFWMFIGSLVLLLSAIQMTYTTSIPVWNKLFGLKLAPPENAVAHYNSIQIWLGLVVAFGTGLVQYLSYKSNRINKFFQWAIGSLTLSLVLGIIIAYFQHIPFTEQHIIDFTKADYSFLKSIFFKFPFISTHFLFLVTALFAAIGNIGYFAFVLKGNIKMGGGSIAHFGFGVFMVGVLISQYKKEIISINKSGINFGKEFKENEKLENILLFKDSTLRMADYEVTYKGMIESKPNSFYSVNYVRKDSATGKVLEDFELRPNAQINPKMGLIANPDTKHYWTKDVFTHVSSVADNSRLKDTVTAHELAVGDTFFNTRSYTIFKAIEPNPVVPDGFDKSDKLLVGAILDVNTLQQQTYHAQPVFVIDLKQGNTISSIDAVVKELGLRFEVAKIDPQTKKITILSHEQEKPSEFIIMKAIVFPYINLVWLGGIITFLGSLLSMFRRIREK